MEVVGLMRELLREENVGVVSLDASYMERSVPIKSFVEEIREKFMGDIVDQALSNRKPVQILPFINYPVWEEKGCDLNFLEDWSQILSEVTVHIDQTVNMDLLVNYLRTIPGNVAFILKADWRENLNIDLLLESLKDRSVPITIDSSYQCIPVIERTYASDFIYRVSVAFPIDHSAWEAVVRKEQALGHSFNYFFKITSEADYQVAEQLIETYPIGNYQLDPVYTGQNLDFFQENIFLTHEDILASSLSMKELFRKRTINQNDFGKLRILPNGDIRANLHHPVLGNITTCSIYEIIQKEIKEGKSWLRIRNQSPCNTCLYRDLCPSPSDYELEIGYPNLCWISKHH